MMRLSALVRLQNLDYERDEKRHRVEQITRSLAHNPKLASARTEQTATHLHLTQLGAEMQDAELAAKSLDTKIKEVEKQLSSGRITNPKELDALEKDRQMHLRHRGELDTKILELLEAIERVQKSAATQDAALNKATASNAHDSQKLAHERDVITAQLAALDAEIETLRTGLDAEALGAYDRLRQSRAGRAISRLKQSACSTCGVQIPSGLVSHIGDEEELVFCPGCERILAA